MPAKRKRTTAAKPPAKKEGASSKRLDQLENAVRFLLGGDAQRFLGSDYQESEVYAGEKG
jgi:hypothetical protein